MKKPSRRRLWYWICHWTNGYGGFHPDMERCLCESRKGWPNKEQAEAAAARHAAQHEDRATLYQITEPCVQVYRQCESVHEREKRGGPVSA